MASALSKQVDDILREIGDAVDTMKRSFKDRQANSANEIRSQNQQIRRAEERLLRELGPTRTAPKGSRPYSGGPRDNHKKGEYGERQTVARMAELGYKPIDGNTGSVNRNGIDHIFMNDRGHIVIVESKFGRSRLGNTASGGRQMSMPWLFGKPDSLAGRNRVEAAMAHDPKLMQEVMGGLQMNSVSTMLSKINKDGEVSLHFLDDAGRRR